MCTANKASGARSGQALSVRVPGCQKLQMTAYPGLAPDALLAVHICQQWGRRVNVDS